MVTQSTPRKPPLAPFTFERRDLRPNDVGIEILYCGVCHSDLHTARGDWDGLIYPNGTVYPCVPGHEIVGRVTAVGSAVGKFKEGDLVGVGMPSELTLINQVKAEKTNRSDAVALV
jgi:D-arabinose 1-dehydrogenase-like Zn-dependent alcohol dehydrogenase